MKKLIFKLSLFFPLFFSIILFNFIVDPARLFKSRDYEKKAAEDLISGLALTDFSCVNFDGRALDEFLIRFLPHKRDIGVFGSSRILLISSKIFPGKTVLNNGLYSPPASVEDFIGLYEIYRENKVLPSAIVIGVDPGFFIKIAL